MARGRLLSTTDAANRTTTLTRDSRGRVSKVEKPDGKTIELKYDASGRRTEAKDEKGRISKTTFDAKDRVSAVTNFRPRSAIISKWLRLPTTSTERGSRRT